MPGWNPIQSPPSALPPADLDYAQPSHKIKMMCQLARIQKFRNSFSWPSNQFCFANFKSPYPRDLRLCQRSCYKTVCCSLLLILSHKSCGKWSADECGSLERRLQSLNSNSASRCIMRKWPISTSMSRGTSVVYSVPDLQNLNWPSATDEASEQAVVSNSVPKIPRFSTEPVTHIALSALKLCHFTCERNCVKVSLQTN